VCKLLNSIYGLKQSGRNWNNFLNERLLELGLLQCVNDPCVSIEDEIIIWTYVDDMLFVGKKNKIAKFKRTV
jgi:hypothetical protein